MKAHIHEYPFNKDCALIVTIDDLHPEKGFGYKRNELLWNQLEKIKKIHSDITFTLYTVADWIDKADFPSGIFFPLRKLYRLKRTHTDHPFTLTHPQYAAWIKTLHGYEKSGFIEVGYHGLYHHNNLKGVPTSQEFAGISEKEMDYRISTMIQIFARAGFKGIRSFRPPGWGIDRKLLKILAKNTINVIAGSSDFVHQSPSLTQAAGLKKMNIDSITETQQVYTINANCFPQDFRRSVSIARNHGVIVIHTHIHKTTFGLNHIDQHFHKNITNIIHEIKNQTLKHIWFTTPTKLVNYKKSLEHIQCEKSIQETYDIYNNGDISIEGLTVTIHNRTYVLPKIAAHSKYTLHLKKSTPQIPKVSAVLTVYNGAQNVIPSLQSLCNQTYTNLEIIVVNDGSTDNTADVLKTYARSMQDTRIKILNQTNQGRSKARNNGFKLSDGEIVTFCEDDALYDKDYIAQAAKHFTKKSKKLAGVIGPHYVWNKMESLNTRAKDIERRRNFFHYKPQSCWFYARSTFEKIGMFPEDVELIEDVIPAHRLKRQGYHFIYEDACRWLHKEPASLKNYLRRKYRGGIGLALLHKLDYRKVIIPQKYIFALILAILLLLLLSKYAPLYIIALLFIAPIAGLLIRYTDIKKSRIISDEPLHIILVSIILEYIWWVATLWGIIYGMRKSQTEISSYLKGR